MEIGLDYTYYTTLGFDLHKEEYNEYTDIIQKERVQLIYRYYTNRERNANYLTLSPLAVNFEDR